MKPSSQMVESSLKKIKPTEVLQEANVGKEGLLEEVTFKKGLEGRVFKVEETASVVTQPCVQTWVCSSFSCLPLL